MTKPRDLANSVNTGPSAGVAIIEGHFRVTVAGTLIPQVSLGVANAAVVQTNSYFTCLSAGSDSVISVGNWS